MIVYLFSLVELNNKTLRLNCFCMKFGWFIHQHNNVDDIKVEISSIIFNGL
jgi:hypothetical protein